MSVRLVQVRCSCLESPSSSLTGGPSRLSVASASSSLSRSHLGSLSRRAGSSHTCAPSPASCRPACSAHHGRTIDAVVRSHHNATCNQATLVEVYLPNPVMVVQGHVRKSTAVMKAIAAGNGKSMSQRPLAATAPSGPKATLSDTFRVPMLRRRMCVMMTAWCFVSLGYYGVALALDSLPGSLYVKFFFIALIEFPSYFTAMKVRMTLPWVLSRSTVHVKLHGGLISSSRATFLPSHAECFRPEPSCVP